MTNEVLALITLVVCGVIAAVNAVAANRTRRWIATRFDPAAYGMPPRAALLPNRAGRPPAAHLVREHQAVADAAWEGDWRPAAGWVAAPGKDWDERWSRVQLLARIAVERDDWLRTWREAEPGSCDAAVVEAELMVRRAWLIRGSGRAREVPAEAMAGFRARLPAAVEAARRAALLDPADPGPWVVMVTAARGLGYRHARFRRLWAELTARAPHHYDAHWQALQYWCPKWRGSERALLRFARRAVRKAPTGSPLACLMLYALYERARATSAGEPLRAVFERRELKAAAAALALVPEHDPRVPVLRHLLAHHLVRARMWRAALEQFRILGPWCGAVPWIDGTDPAAAFHATRALAAAKSRARPAGDGSRALVKQQGMVW